MRRIILLAFGRHFKRLKSAHYAKKKLTEGLEGGGLLAVLGRLYQWMQFNKSKRGPGPLLGPYKWSQAHFQSWL